MTLGRFSLRQLRGRPGRSLLTLLGIVIGVSTVVSVWVTTGTVRSGLGEMFNLISGRASLEVHAEAGAGLDAGLPLKLAELPGVEAAVPVVQVPAALLVEGKTAPVLLLGIDPQQDRQARDYELREGTFLETPGLMIEVGFAEGLGLKVGEDVRLLTPRGLRTLPVTATLEPVGAAGRLGGLVLFLPLEEAQGMTTLGDQISSIHLVLEPGASEARVRQAVSDALPTGADVQLPAGRGELAQRSLLGTEIGLANAGILSIVLGAFIILNTFLMNLSERRRQLAALRATGATRSQVGRMILGEAALFGTLGALIGVPAGILTAWATTFVMAMALQLPAMPTLAVGGETILLGLALGPGVSLLAAWMPSVMARNVSPLELARQPSLGKNGRWRWASALGLVCLLFTGGIAAGLHAGAIAPEWSALSTALGLGSLILVIPLLFRPLVKAVSWITSPVHGVIGSIAFRQLLRKPLRNSLTVGVMCAALAMAIAMGNSILVSVQDMRDWHERTIVGDYLVRSVMPDPALLVIPALPESLEQDIRNIDGVTDVRPLKFAPVRVDGARAMLITRKLPADGSVHLDLHTGHAGDVRQALERGDIVVGLRLANHLGKSVGDEVILKTPTGPKTARIAGTITELTAGGMALYMEWDTARRLFELEGVDVFLIDAPASAEPALVELTDDRSLLLQSQRSFRELIARMTAGVIGSMWTLLAVLLVVAAFGVVNTLTMNVLEQTRELGLLRAVAMTRAQVRRSVIGQAAAMALVSFVPAGLCGFGMAYLMSLSTPAMLGVPLDFTVHWGFIGGAFVVAFLITVLAGCLPALRASRLDIVHALKYE